MQLLAVVSNLSKFVIPVVWVHLKDAVVKMLESLVAIKSDQSNRLLHPLSSEDEEIAQPLTQEMSHPVEIVVTDNLFHLLYSLEPSCNLKYLVNIFFCLNL